MGLLLREWMRRDFGYAAERPRGATWGIAWSTLICIGIKTIVGRRHKYSYDKRHLETEEEKYFQKSEQITTHAKNTIESIAWKFRKHMIRSFITITQAQDEQSKFIEKTVDFENTYLSDRIFGSMDRISDRENPNLVLLPIYHLSSPYTWKAQRAQFFNTAVGIGRQSLRPRRSGGNVPPLPLPVFVLDHG